MGAKRMNGLAAEVIMFKKCVDRHRHRTPIVRIAEINFIVGIQIIGQVQYLRASFFLQISFRLGNAGLIVVGIRLCLLDSVELTVGKLCQHTGCFFGVSNRNSTVRTAEIVFSRTGVKCNQGCHVKSPFPFHKPASAMGVDIHRPYPMFPFRGSRLLPLRRADSEEIRAYPQAPSPPHCDLVRLP